MKMESKSYSLPPGAQFSLNGEPIGSVEDLTDLVDVKIFKHASCGPTCLQSSQEDKLLNKLKNQITLFLDRKAIAAQVKDDIKTGKLVITHDRPTDKEEHK